MGERLSPFKDPVRLAEAARMFRMARERRLAAEALAARSDAYRDGTDREAS